MIKETIRTMTLDDVNDVYAIEHEVSTNPWTKFIFRNCVERYGCWVMCLESKIIGFGILMLSEHEAHVLNIAVDQSYQRQGHGRKMLEHLLKEARIAKAEDIFLEVRNSNEQALSLYKNVGFKPVGFRKDYYQTDTGREDARVLLKHLDNI